MQRHIKFVFLIATLTVSQMPTVANACGMGAVGALFPVFVTFSPCLTTSDVFDSLTKAIKGISCFKKECNECNDVKSKRITVLQQLSDLSDNFLAKGETTPELDDAVAHYFDTMKEKDPAQAALIEGDKKEIIRRMQKQALEEIRHLNSNP